MTVSTVKWGIMGPGRISGDFANELVHAPGAELVAVAGRSKEKADEFAAKYNVPRAYGSCEELANDPDVQIVYIGTLHTVHCENALTLLNAGKAVLCEKPLTMNAAESAQMIELARRKGLFLMEGMWTRHLPVLVKVREWLREGRIGETKLLKAEFGFDAGWNPSGRLLDPAKGGGALLDAGIYPVSLASMVFGGEQPKRIESSAVIGETGVDEQFSLLFEYAGGGIASLQGAVRLGMNNDAWIYGTQGKIYIKEFLWSREATLYAKDAEPETFVDKRETRGFVFQQIEAMNALREGRKESPAIPLDESQAIMQTLDAIRKQWNLTYENDRK
ncbi:Gfo/Idh/MocA family protein [Paenibacillus cymbidii]|uniref:Gfo/Idh/MocA family protein n=1 Tax=Paenibacillus cymbidii TaxID=1639034 RepID=UPI001080BEAA|nr:Gfo/Idh/MocA family oxidoreductase [Paenibacillus cymbidii]